MQGNTNTHARCGLRQSLLLMAAMCTVLAAGCSDDKPATFQDDCEIDAGTCKAPFSCYAVPAHEDPFCTRPCKHKSECPDWDEDNGHCEGHIQAECDQGFCQGWCQ